MKNLLKIQLGFILSLFFALQAQAQTYNFPSQERVETLLEAIDKCKDVIADTQQRIKTMEANPDDYSLANYQDAKDLIDRAQGCLNQNRGELDSLRKEFPGWFNSPSTTMPLKKGKTISSGGLNKKLAALENKIKAILDSMRELEKPEH
ncbi:MAG: hypothetical protein GY931_19245 [Maribacter sp.]|nr:hypothetical protein [Maribacter sp.]